ncbi:N-acetyltransferase [Kribbella sp. NBC_01245]|uniref:GNAT family N-acetyltransferase n=1 Tax=Kribbella sp. NBC_01245 TaxID=2903578 RepID=UPI002E2DAE36|nr:N-acetyltransferase [Kribbella sp. NBC_01245]
MPDQVWNVRVETPADIPAIRSLLVQAFPAEPHLGDVLDGLRADPDTWLPELSVVAEEATTRAIIGHALITRCRIDEAPALALGPCGVVPDWQNQGVGSAVIRAALAAARAQPENLVVVLGHPTYYPRFGFAPASRLGLRATFEAGDAMMAQVFDDSRPHPTGTIYYAKAWDQ